jgi:hypothetical protein
MTSTESALTDWLRLIKAEYLEIPGLRLTKPQFERLWGLDPSTSNVVLATLVAHNFLRRTDTGAYVLVDAGR